MQNATDTSPIVTPVTTRNTPALGPVSVMAATIPDYNLLKDSLGFDGAHKRPLFTSSLITESGDLPGLSLCGPFIGAPLAAMILETLIAWGVTKVIFVGWCGSIHSAVHIGDILLPEGAIVDEGTSLHYQRKHFDVSMSSGRLRQRACDLLKAENVPYKEGLVWTTDGAFRESPQKVLSFREKGALVVEMELSALFSLGTFHDIQVCGLLVVSDELSSLIWKPGFKEERFKKARAAAAGIIRRLCESLI